MFGINYSMNILLILIFAILFILATIMLGPIFTNFKNQISSVFCSMLVILIPVFISTVAFFASLPVFFKVLIYILPLGAFELLFNSLMYNGVVVWFNVLILFVQIVVYYIIAYLLFKKRTKK